MKFRLYCGLIRNGEWYNYTEVNPLIGGRLALLDTVEKTGSARLLALMKGSVSSFFTEEGKEYILRPEDYDKIYVADSWKIGYEQVKLKTGEQYPIITENFYCNRCSIPGRERYTEVNESWQKLIDDGLIDEFYLDSEDTKFEVELPDPIVIPGGRSYSGGTFSKIIRRQLTLEDVSKIHKDPSAMETESNMIHASWDASIIEVVGLPSREFNIIKRIPGEFFSKKYITISTANYDAMEIAEDQHAVGIVAIDRSISCRHCGAEIGGYIDNTNFFSPLLPKKSIQGRKRNSPV